VIEALMNELPPSLLLALVDDGLRLPMMTHRALACITGPFRTHALRIRAIDSVLQIESIGALLPGEAA
jgi:hypothetical protein